MPISKPILPPVKGFVEVESNGERVYKEVSTGKLFRAIPSYNPTEEQQQIADNELAIMLLKQALENK